MRYELGSKVRLVDSSEKGIITGRAEYMDQADQYQVRYLAGDGRQVSAWWCEADLTEAA